MTIENQAVLNNQGQANMCILGQQDNCGYCASARLSY